jgi:SAM-dependent methyltransferase
VASEAALVAGWRAEERAPFAGWDFSHLRGRMDEDPTPWSYEERAAGLLPGAGTALDVDTGGGERLLELRAHWPVRMVATEGHPPNVRLAAERLRPFGVEVVHAGASEIAPMPFADASVGLVLNRHGAFDADELARVLRPGGAFLSQQVHGQWASDLLAVFGATPRWPEASPERYVPRLVRAGLVQVEAQDWTGRLTFADVGAIVYYLTNVPWLVPGFAVDRHLDALLGLQRRLEGEGRLVFAARKYLLHFRKDEGVWSRQA